MKGRREKYIFSGGVYQWEGVGTKKWEMRVNMVDVFCFNI
jgi:hypothetical protein